MTKKSPTDSDMENDNRTIDAPSLYESQNDFQSLISDPISLPYSLAQYKLTEEIGRGGMGIVFKAQDTNQNFYAIKILKHLAFGTEDERQRFRKEAILHSRIESNHVVKHIEFSSVKKIDYIVSEYIQGSNLQKLLPVVFKLGPDAALRIIRDVLLGLKDIHEQKILHRDIKPGNIIVTLNQNASPSRFDTDDIQRAQLVDLGLARQIFQSESLAMTKTMAAIGTPLYMAPEQSDHGADVDAPTDIYSAGCTLYHMLAGRPPFDARLSADIAEMHRNETPQNLSRINPKVKQVLNDVVQRALQKSPNDRYGSAIEMLADIEAILNSEPIAHIPFPLTPGKQYRTYSFKKIFNCTPDKLWPFVSETDRFNRAVGLPPPEFIFEGTGESRKRIARTQFNGLKISWQEHPFEWIVNKRMTVLREFASGPFQWVTNSVYLEPISRNRTRLIHEFQVEPRGWFGKMITPIQFGFATPRDLNRVYAEIEELAARNDRYACDAALATRKKNPTSISFDNLTKSKNELLARGHDMEIVSGLTKYLCQSSDSAVSRIRPYALARQLELSNVKFLNACLESSSLNLLQLYWDVICPVCRLAANTVDSVKELESHSYCEVCEASFAVDFANSIEGVFSVHPEIRKVDRRTYCVGGPFHSPHVVAQIKLPKTKFELEHIPFESGPYSVHSRQISEALRIESHESSIGRNLDMLLPPAEPTTMHVSTGDVYCKIDNKSNQDLLIRIERSSERSDALSVFELIENPKFGETFSSEIESVEDLIHPFYGLIVALRVEDFDKLAEAVGESKSSRFWNELKTELENVVSPWSVASTNFHQLILVSESNHYSVSEILNTVTRFMREKIAFSLCLTRDNFQVSGGSHSKRFFGKAMRNLTKLSNSSIVGQISIHQSLVDAQLNEWLENHTRRPELNSKDSRFHVFELL